MVAREQGPGGGCGGAEGPRVRRMLSWDRGDAVGTHPRRGVPGTARLQGVRRRARWPCAPGLRVTSSWAQAVTPGSVPERGTRRSGGMSPAHTAREEIRARPRRVPGTCRAPGASRGSLGAQGLGVGRELSPPGPPSTSSPRSGRRCEKIVVWRPTAPRITLVPVRTLHSGSPEVREH